VSPSPLPLGVYVHVPWCRRRCPYCDFYFEVGKPDGRFRSALRTELSARREEAGGQAATSLYFGGGTPSMLDPPTLAAIIDDVHAIVGLEEGAEVTLEANPEDTDADTVAGWIDAGIGRVSLGTQAFDDEALRFLGRAHTAAQARRAIATCAARLRVCADVIGGLPGDDVNRCVADVKAAVEAGAGQVSFYLLTIEEGTPLARRIGEGRVPMPDDDAQADAYDATSTTLHELGLRHVEVSSWSRPGQEPRHNRLYWGKGRYLGVGPGAHSMWPDGSAVGRRHTTATLGPWLADPIGAEHTVERLAPLQAAREALAFGLRDLLAGVDVDELEDRHGVTLAVDEVLRAREAMGHLKHEGRRWWLTEAGALLADGVARDLLAPGRP
jgi:putative oxygen-independent coproporphyrinogen III oxidase